jgi:hypothetical protein
MDSQIKKTEMLRIRLRGVDRALLEEICKRRGWNLSEGVRRSITDEAAKQGLHSDAGVIVERRTGDE